MSLSAPSGAALTANQEACLPTDEDVRFYEEHGWWISDRVLSAEVIESALFGVERWYAGEIDFQLPLRLAGGDRTDPTELRQEDYLSLQLQEFHDLVRQPVIAAMAASLARSPTIRLFHDQLVYKPACGAGTNETAVGWHTDRAYWQTCTSDKMLTAWIPLTACTVENGALRVIDKSHKWPRNDRLALFHVSDLASTLRQVNAPAAQHEEIVFVTSPGQVCFHNCNTVHGSSANLSSMARIAYSVHLQDSENRYRRRVYPDKRVAVHINDQLCRKDEDGLTDYADDDVCPVLWG